MGEMDQKGPVQTKEKVSVFLNRFSCIVTRLETEDLRNRKRKTKSH